MFVSVCADRRASIGRAIKILKGLPAEAGVSATLIQLSEQHVDTADGGAIKECLSNLNYNSRLMSANMTELNDVALLMSLPERVELVPAADRSNINAVWLHRFCYPGKCMPPLMAMENNITGHQLTSAWRGILYVAYIYT